MSILDSGARREFETGAVRDIAEGKGRCDWLPLDIASEWTGYKELDHINTYIRTGNTDSLLLALDCFIYGENKETALLEVAKHFEEGCKKYGDRNWELGLPCHCYIDSAVRHFLKHKRLDTDEQHGRAFIWNILCCIWTHKHKPEMQDLPFIEAPLANVTKALIGIKEGFKKCSAEIARK